MPVTVGQRDIARLRKNIRNPRIKIFDAIQACRDLLRKYPSWRNIVFVDASVRLWLRSGRPRKMRWAAIYENEILDLRVQDRERKLQKKKEAELAALANAPVLPVVEIKPVEPFKAPKPWANVD